MERYCEVLCRRLIEIVLLVVLEMESKYHLLFLFEGLTGFALLFFAQPSRVCVGKSFCF